MRAIDKDGCSKEFYAEVGTNLKKDEFLVKYEQFNVILKLYNIDTLCYIEQMDKNVIDLRDRMRNLRYNNISYDILIGVLAGIIITSVEFVLISKIRNLH
jgi:hypothetical protein